MRDPPPHPVQTSHAALLAAHCSVSVSMVTGAAAPFWALAWLCRRPARLSALPSACPAMGAASSSPSRCPQALPGWAQESVFTNTIHTAPWAPQLCPEDVRPRAPGGGPGARLSAAQETLSLACCSLAVRRPGESSQPRGTAAGTGADEAPARPFLECLLHVPGLGTHCTCVLQKGSLAALPSRTPCRLPGSWDSQAEVKTVELEVTSRMSQSSGLTEQMEKRKDGREVGVEDLWKSQSRS